MLRCLVGRIQPFPRARPKAEIPYPSQPGRKSPVFPGTYYHELSIRSHVPGARSQSLTGWKQAFDLVADATLAGVGRRAINTNVALVVYAADACASFDASATEASDTLHFAEFFELPLKAGSGFL